MGGFESWVYCLREAVASGPHDIIRAGTGSDERNKVCWMLGRAENGALFLRNSCGV